MDAIQNETTALERFDFSVFVYFGLGVTMARAVWAKLTTSQAEIAPVYKIWSDILDRWLDDKDVQNKPLSIEAKILKQKLLISEIKAQLDGHAPSVPFDSGNWYYDESANRSCWVQKVVVVTGRAEDKDGFSGHIGHESGPCRYVPPGDMGGGGGGHSKWLLSDDLGNQQGPDYSGIPPEANSSASEYSYVNWLNYRRNEWIQAQIALRDLEFLRQQIKRMRLSFNA